MAKGLLYHLCSFEMIFIRKGDKQKDSSQSPKVEGFLSARRRPLSMARPPRTQEPERSGEERGNRETLVFILY